MTDNKLVFDTSISENALLVFALQFRTTDGRVKQMNQFFVVAKNMAAALVEVQEFLATEGGKGLDIQAIQVSGFVLPGNLPGGILRTRD